MPIEDGVYFSYFPTIPYDVFDDSGEYKVVTDIFKRVRATLESRVDKSIYYTYTIPEKETPETVAYKYYGQTRYHWVILFMNSIRDPQWDWPLDVESFERFIAKKYGSGQIARDTHSHYETKEIKAPTNGYGYIAGEVVLKSGITVDAGFSYSYGGSTWGPASTPPGPSDPIESKSMYDIEEKFNEDKRTIVLLRRNDLQRFVDEFEDLITRRR